MRTYLKIFYVDKDKLKEMLALRRSGWTYQSLALIYGVDHSSIYKWCLIYKVPKPHNTISINIPELISNIGLPIVREKPLKSYKDYLEEEHKRKYPKLYSVSYRV